MPDDDAISSVVLTTKLDKWWMGKVIDSSGWLGDRGLCPGWQIPSLLDPCNPSIAFIQPPEPPFIPPPAASDPSSQSCFCLPCAGSQRVPTYRSSEWDPTVSCPTHNQSLWQTEMDWDIHDPVTSREAPRPTKGLLSVWNNRGGGRRSEQVKSATPGRKLWQCSGGKFFSL